MSRRKRQSRDIAALPAATSASWIMGQEAYETLCTRNYTRLSDNPEVQMAVNYIADLVSSATIFLMRNTDKGDKRVRNELSKHVDIHPCSSMTRKTWMYNIVRTMILEGNQVCWPKTSGGKLCDILPLPPGNLSFEPDGDGYKIFYNGQQLDPANVLHFVVNPNAIYPWRGDGYRVALKDVANNLKQAAATKKGFLASKWKPSIIVKVDALTEEFANKEGRAKLLESYLGTADAGEPWMIPAEQFAIEQVKPLSLNDLAINDTVTLDKKTVAGILGVPAYVTGAAPFNREEHRNFINTRIMAIADIVQQELTRKLLISPDMYFMLSKWALYGYDLKEVAEVGENGYVRGYITGNEIRNWIGLSPRDGLDELVILENFIPAGSIADQKKLMQKGGKTDE